MDTNNHKSPIKIAVMADGYVGSAITKFLLKNYPKDVEFLFVTDDKSNIYNIGKNFGFKQQLIFKYKDAYTASTQNILSNAKLDYIFLVWWPYIIKEPLISLPRCGMVNFHPSLLPYNRGKNYNFWTLVENSPFGVSIHFVDKGIDTGDILFQQTIEKTWEDTGETLYHKAQTTIIDLFINNYPNLRSGNWKRIPQDLSKGSFHKSAELDPSSEIFLDKQYSGRELLNLIRARTFTGYPATYFWDNGNKYEVRISITKSNNFER